MAVTSLKENWEDRGGEYSPTLTINDVAANNSFGVVVHRRSWRAITNNTLDGDLTVANTVGVPAIYDPYVEPNGTVDPTCLCSRVQIKPDKMEPTLWHIQAEYRTDLLPNPLTRPTEIEIDFAPYQRAVQEDNAGNPITNSADDPFDPPPTVDDSRVVLRFRRNEPVPSDASFYITYQDAINTDNWWGLQPKQAKVMKIKVIQQYDSLIPYVKVEYEIQVRWEGWQLLLLDKGFHVIDPTSMKQVLARDPIDGAPYAQPVLLDGTGKQLAQGGQPVYIQFDVYQDQAFAALHLPS